YTRRIPGGNSPYRTPMAAYARHTAGIQRIYSRYIACICEIDARSRLNDRAPVGASLECCRKGQPVAEKGPCKFRVVKPASTVTCKAFPNSRENFLIQPG